MESTAIHDFTGNGDPHVIHSKGLSQIRDPVGDAGPPALRIPWCAIGKRIRGWLILGTQLKDEISSGSWAHRLPDPVAHRVRSHASPQILLGVFSDSPEASIHNDSSGFRGVPSGSA